MSTETDIVRRHCRVITAGEIRKAFGLPANAEIVVTVPGGGDWSNADLEIDQDTALVAKWETKRTIEGKTQKG